MAKKSVDNEKGGHFNESLFEKRVMQLTPFPSRILTRANFEKAVKEATLNRRHLYLNLASAHASMAKLGYIPVAGNGDYQLSHLGREKPLKTLSDV